MDSISFTKTKMDNANDNMKPVVEKYFVNENDRKLETELSSVIVFDEVYVKAEIKEEPIEYAEPRSPRDVEIENYIKYELSGTSQGVYCDKCWTYCEDLESLEVHQECRTSCKQYNICLSDVEDKPDSRSQDESCKNYLLQNSIKNTDVECCKGVIVDCLQTDCHYDTQLFDKTNEMSENIMSNVTENRHICKQSFSKMSDLDIHMKTHTVEKPFSCNMCSQTFTRKNYLNAHKIIHAKEKSLSCDVCNISFTHRVTLNNHKLMHTTKTPFSCDVCNQSFIRKAALNIHRLTHSVGKPFSDYVYNQVFTQKSGPNNHKEIHTDERKFHCDICNQTFALKRSLNNHKLRHTDKSILNQAFTQNSNLNIHELKHVTGNPISCDVCNQTFTHKSILKRHKQIHIKETSFFCDVCNQIFNRNLQDIHKRIHSRSKV